MGGGASSHTSTAPLPAHWPYKNRRRYVNPRSKHAGNLYESLDCKTLRWIDKTLSRIATSTQQPPLDPSTDHENPLEGRTVHSLNRLLDSHVHLCGIGRGRVTRGWWDQHCACRCSRHSTRSTASESQSPAMQDAVGTIRPPLCSCVVSMPHRVTSVPNDSPRGDLSTSPNKTPSHSPNTQSHSASHPPAPHHSSTPSAQSSETRVQASVHVPSAFLRPRELAAFMRGPAPWEQSGCYVNFRMHSQRQDQRALQDSGALLQLGPALIRQAQEGNTSEKPTHSDVKEAKHVGEQTGGMHSSNYIRTGGGELGAATVRVCDYCAVHCADRADLLAAMARSGECTLRTSRSESTARRPDDKSNSGADEKSQVPVSSEPRASSDTASQETDDSVADTKGPVDGTDNPGVQVETALSVDGAELCAVPRADMFSDHSRMGRPDAQVDSGHQHELSLVSGTMRCCDWFHKGKFSVFMGAAGVKTEVRAEDRNDASLGIQRLRSMHPDEQYLQVLAHRLRNCYVPSDPTHGHPKALLLAFAPSHHRPPPHRSGCARCCDVGDEKEQGGLDVDKGNVVGTGVSLHRTGFSVPNMYVWRCCVRFPQLFEMCMSIHPYCADAVEQLEYWASVADRWRSVWRAERQQATASLPPTREEEDVTSPGSSNTISSQNTGGTLSGDHVQLPPLPTLPSSPRVCKWLPNSMNIDLSDPICVPFYRALARHHVTLLCHVGFEHSVDAGFLKQSYGNPLLLRYPLAYGVRVIAAHCASEGHSMDIDRYIIADLQDRARGCNSQLKPTVEAAFSGPSMTSHPANEANATSYPSDRPSEQHSSSSSHSHDGIEGACACFVPGPSCLTASDGAWRRAVDRHYERLSVILRYTERIDAGQAAAASHNTHSDNDTPQEHRSTGQSVCQVGGESGQSVCQVGGESGQSVSQVGGESGQGACKVSLSSVPQRTGETQRGTGDLVLPEEVRGQYMQQSSLDAEAKLSDGGDGSGSGGGSGGSGGGDGRGAKGQKPARLPKVRKRPAFQLWTRLMREPCYRGLLFADVSSMVGFKRIHTLPPLLQGGDAQHFFPEVQASISGCFGTNGAAGGVQEDGVMSSKSRSDDDNKQSSADNGANTDSARQTEVETDNVGSGKDRQTADLSAQDEQKRSVMKRQNAFSVMKRQNAFPLNRLVFGTDYPVPCVWVVTWTSRARRMGLISSWAEDALDTVFKHNPVLFDLLLKAALRVPRGTVCPAAGKRDALQQSDAPEERTRSVSPVHPAGSQEDGCVCGEEDGLHGRFPRSVFVRNPVIF